MYRLFFAVVVQFASVHASHGQSLINRSGDRDALPHVPVGFNIEFAAREPLVRNPCSMTFDFAGRMFVAMGPQYRNPKPDTPGDSVFIMIDEDGDGLFDSKKQFATGFNSIQSIAWRGRDLWVANAPDLTVVRDLDGDDMADQYVRVFTNLGNLEHGLHGLNWGPDGRLYMSKGNSKGLSQTGRIAPKPFRDLWGVVAPVGTPDFPAPVKTSAMNYQRTYHDPADDWGREGGVLVCDDMGENLEIVTRGVRNPWDIAYDSGFNWQGTDNDQTEGDRVFTPFFGAHYGWGHPWSAHWTGRDHPPTAPISGRVFNGSGTGLCFYDSKQFPEKYQGAWFFNDWLRRTVFFYRPVWDGALMQPEGGDWTEFVTGGDSLFKPTDIEVGPDGSLYILGWGRGYGAEFNESGKQSNEGRIFRVTWGHELTTVGDPKFHKPLEDWSHAELVEEFYSSLAARKIGVQDELIRRHAGQEQENLFDSFDWSDDDVLRQTWTLWTIGRLYCESGYLDGRFGHIAGDRTQALNVRIQALRICGHRVRTSTKWRALSDETLRLVGDVEPRVRLAATLAIRRATQKQAAEMLIDALATERDRVVFYAGWQTLRDLVSRDERHKLLSDVRPQVRRAALLSLAEDRDLQDEEARRLLADVDDQSRQVAALWLAKKAATPFLEVDPPPGEFEGNVEVEARSAMKPADIRVTTDGSLPTLESTRWSGKINIAMSTTLRAVVFVDGKAVGPVATLDYHKLTANETAARSGIISVKAQSGRKYRVVDGGFANGSLTYTDRDYRFEDVPTELAGSLLVKTSNDDSGSTGSDFLRIETVLPMTVLLGHDTRMTTKPEWLSLSTSGFAKSGKTIRTGDATFDLYSKTFDSGRITLGGNTRDGNPNGKSNYLVILQPEPLPKLSEPTVVATATSMFDQADANRGRTIFFARQGVGCAKCHRADGTGKSFGPDLRHLVQKRDPVHIVTSMLVPNAEIKEGFVTQTIVTSAGKTISGLLREETTEAVTLAQADKPDAIIPVSEIEKRFSQKVSAMPDFRTLLTPQAAADVTAWLLTRKDEYIADGEDVAATRGELAGKSDNDVRDSGPGNYSKKNADFSIEQKSDRLVVKLNGNDFATYLYRHEKLTRPAWVHVYSTSGVRLTRNFPPRPDEDMGAADHKFMHPGIWISFGHLDGEDYWRLTSRTRHVEFVEAPYVRSGRTGFTVQNHYLRRDDQSVVCKELTKYTLIATQGGVAMLVDARFKSDDRDFYFGDQEESGLAVRMESKLRVQNGSGTILNSNGEKNGADTWGKEASWVDYSGTTAGRRVGVMVVPDVHNARRCWMHTRDYGLVVANPFPKQPKERREPYVKTTVTKGKVFRLSYGVLLHDAPETAKTNLKQSYETVSKLMQTLQKND